MRSSDDRYVSGGYFLVKPMLRAAGMSELAPAKIVTVSECLCTRVPSTWALSWTSDGEEERRRIASELGLDDDARAALTRWADAQFDQELAWPGVFLSLDPAIEVRDRWLRGADVVLIGISLDEQDCAALLEHARPRHEQEGVPGVLAALDRGLTPDPRGVFAGHDVLGWDAGTLHSYVCNGLEIEFDAKLGIRANEQGYFNRDDARRCAALAGDDATGAEPGLWLPWRVAIYS